MGVVVLLALLLYVLIRRWHATTKYHPSDDYIFWFDDE